MKETIYTFLKGHADRDAVSFHMPGHKGSRLYRDYGYGEFMERIMDMDVTEIPGADNLFQPETVIREVMNRYRDLYQVKGSYLLINGSSGGLIGAMLASVPKGGKIIMARNCHKSVFNGLRLGDIEPVYAYPELIEETGIAGEIKPEEICRCLKEEPDAAAVILPSPNYYGICSDIKAIAEEVHRQGKILIVDQAHGAHLKFFDMWATDAGLPHGAEVDGADLVINSVHKTLGSFTQTAVLNLCTERVDKYVVEDMLQMVESTSPSYPLMTTLDINADLLENHGRELINSWAANIDYFYREATKIPGLVVMDHQRLDRTKLNLDMSAYGISGNRLEELLMEQDIFAELVTGNILMCMTGIGNRRCDYERLLQVLRDLAKEGGEQKHREETKGTIPISTKRQALKKIPKKTERIHLDGAADKVCAMSIIPYPPGIPLVCPGEVVTPELVEQIKALRRAGEKVIGVDEENRIVVGV